MTTAKQLYELQEIDLDLERKAETLAQLKSQLGRDELLVAARAVIDTMRKRLADLEHQQRTAEWVIDDLGAKIALAEKKLYGGSVTSPKELMNLQQEVELLKKQCREREEQLLAIMLEVEAAQQEISKKSSELVGMEREWREEQQLLSRGQSELEADLATIESKRDLVLGQADPESFKLYEGLRRTKQGLAVAKVEQGKCQGCRISLSIADLQRARSEQELTRCSNCSRILYLS